MPDYSQYYEARDIISNILFRDFVGPVDPDEILSELPTQYYIMGKLYPQENSGEVIDLVRNPYLENSAETYDASISLSNQKNPSSLGVTCTLKPGVTEIRLSGSYAFYDQIPFENAESQGIDISRWKESEKEIKTLWKRHYIKFCEDFSLGEEKVSEPVNLERGMQLQVYTHAILDSGERIITGVLINTNLVKPDDKVAEINRYCAFQAALRLSSSDSEQIFTDTGRQTQLATDEEQLELQLLYSDVKCYGQGHGCSVEWDLDNEEPYWVSSSWFPSYDLHQMVAGEIEGKQVLSIKFLSGAAPEEVIRSIRIFLSSYSRWIDGQQAQISSLEERYRPSAQKNISKCKEAYNRMSHSVDLMENGLGSGGVEMRAFQMANEALLMQRKQTRLKNGENPDSEEISWYPFQLAFILHELSSFIDPDGKEREMVDLLWFPTGGGKTEAYLGISAFCIFLRRLRNPMDDGVTVIMRYTLRLLTLQQFERASMMICACEILRKKYCLGGSEISIGLWVGGDLTPNTLQEARRAVQKKQAGDGLSPNDADPCQIQVCPWCGKKIGVQNYRVRMHENRMTIHCSNEECEFSESGNALPVHIIDEEIYEYLPTFIVATVDKFAQVPLSAKPAALFGISSHRNPPDLIIQDELHLISGPLGTITGIYEAAITKLCEKNGRGIKIIASTATIRNASGQIRALYGRDHTQFPPQGISAKDSFFAVESTTEERPARKYMGVMGIGTTMTTSLVRVSADLLFASRYLEARGFEDKVIDNFWTITEYFNSLRELGGASTQVLDDVQSRFRYLANTKFSALEPRVDTSVNYDHKVELTSRMNNADISRIIQVYLKREYRNGIHEDVYDFLLASNMISVGVDVGRLGTMIVAGQPKTNAEYIQATSRVGRDNPGLVITVYNPTRSRDRSHYEQFIRYHSALYRYVEATSLTPFADRARDRGLQALYVSLCRYLVPGMLEDNQAGDYDPERPEIKKIEDMICEYVKTVDPDELDAVMDELYDIEDEWDYRANASLTYRDTNYSHGLLRKDTENDRFRIMNSMRSVDAQAGIYLLGR